MTTRSGFMAPIVCAVSNNVSPLRKDDPSIFILITSAPNLFAAISNEINVLVEGSKKRFIIVLPVSIG